MLGNTVEEILINKLGILTDDTPGLIGPGVDSRLARAFCKSKGLDLYTLQKDDIEFFELSEMIRRNERIQIDMNRKIALLRNKECEGEYVFEQEKEIEYLCMQESLNQLVVQDINKMIVKRAIDILQTKYGIDFALKREDFQDFGLKGRCEEVKIGKTFRYFNKPVHFEGDHGCGPQ